MVNRITLPLQNHNLAKNLQKNLFKQIQRCWVLSSWDCGKKDFFSESEHDMSPFTLYVNIAK